MTAATIVAVVVRYGLVLLFLPFSALDKIFDFDHAVKQAQSIFKPRPLAIAMILIGLFVEIVCTLGVVTGIFSLRFNCLSASGLLETKSRCTLPSLVIDAVVRMRQIFGLQTEIHRHRWLLRYDGDPL
jgi:hypothetical protein